MTTIVEAADVVIDEHTKGELQHQVCSMRFEALRITLRASYKPETCFRTPCSYKRATYITTVACLLRSAIG